MKKNNKKGFTLVELVIVVAVMAILVAVAIPTVASITSKAQSSVDQTNCRTIESIIKLEAAEKSNDSNTYTITAADAAAACTKAKLGIEKDNYYYIVSNGSVVSDKPDTGTAGKEYFVLGFDDAGGCSNTEYVAVPASSGS